MGVCTNGSGKTDMQDGASLAFIYSEKDALCGYESSQVGI